MVKNLPSTATVSCSKTALCVVDIFRMSSSVVLSVECLLKSRHYTSYYNYRFLIECSIAGAHEKIAECKKQILQAKRIRKNRQGKDLKDLGCRYFIPNFRFHEIFNIERQNLHRESVYKKIINNYTYS